MMQFDWNADFYDCVTVQEMVMMENTNDLGEVLTPQSAHVLFTEFIKFMFLNGMYVQTMQSKGINPFRELEIEGESIMA